LIGAYGTVAVLCLAAVVVGQAILSIGGRREFSWLSAPVGLAALLVVAGIAIKLPGHGQAAAIALGAAVAVALVWLYLSGGAVGFVTAVGVAGPAAALALIGASLPFIAAGRIGILGVGLVNDDMAYHLLIADWLGSHSGPMPALVSDGYPVGPHALVDGISQILGSGLVDTFAGLTLALPVLVAALAAGVLADLRGVRRAVGGALVALAYLGAAYLAQEAFKEPIEALLVLGFALLLHSARDARSALPLGVLAAGSVYAYSFPGLAWLVGAAVAYAVLVRLVVGAGWRGGRSRASSARPRRASPTFTPLYGANVGFVRARTGAAVLAAVAILLVLTAPEWARLVDFTGFRAFRSSTISGGLGNLRHQLSPLEALGVWPTSEFRLAAADSSHPIVFYLGAALAAVAFMVALPRWLARRGLGVPAALAAAIVIYLGALALGTVYTSAKALAIAAPLVMLISVGGLLDAGRVRLALASALALAAAASSFLVLREAPVGPTDHASELARFRPQIAGKRVLFLCRDDFVQYDLRGSRPFVAVRNFYDNFYVRPNLRLHDVFQKFDFDSVTAPKLHRFPYVITTRGGFASGPPPWLRLVRRTPSFALWRRVGPLAPRRTLQEGPEPGATLACATPAGRRLRAAGGEATAFTRPPVASGRWRPSATVEDGSPASATLRLPAGRWAISIQYDATREVTVSAPGFAATIPANLDYRGSTPYYRVGEIAVRRAGPVRFTASVERPPLSGRLLGAGSVAHLGAIAASPAGRSPRGVPGDGEAKVALAAACGRYLDWYAP
jgi:hypothetical protein